MFTAFAILATLGLLLALTVIPLIMLFSYGWKAFAIALSVGVAGVATVKAVQAHKRLRAARSATPAQPIIIDGRAKRA
jgi:hypothetical protein